MKRKGVVAILLMIAFTVSLSKELKVGVIYDSVEDVAEYRELLVRELKINLAGSNLVPVIAKEEAGVVVSQFDNVMKSMEKNTDIVVTMGTLGSELTLKRAGGYDDYVVAPFGITYTSKELRNLIYIHEEGDILEDIDLVKSLTDVENLLLYIPGGLDLGPIGESIEALAGVLQREGYKVEVVVSDAPMTEVGKAIEKADLVYMLKATDNNSMDTLNIARSKGIPTFVRDATDEVLDIALMGYANTSEAQRRVRAATVALARVIEGDSIGDTIGELIPTERNIQLNLSVAEDMGIYPDLVLVQKVDVREVKDSDEEVLTFMEGLKKSLANNPELSSRGRDIKTSEYQIMSAKSDRKPNLDLFSEYSKIDSTSAKSPVTQGENNVRGGVSLSYLLFDDNINANVRISQIEKLAREARYRQELLDTVLAYTTAYLNILELNSNLEVEKYNYELLKEFLQISRTKYEVGTAGPEGIFRFESEVSRALTDIVNIQGQIRIAEAELSRVLNEQMGTKYSLESVDLTNEAFSSFTSLMEEKGVAVERVMGYFVERGIALSPEVEQIDLSLEAKERELKASKRERYIPKVSAFGEWSDNLKDDWGTGSSQSASDDRWSVGARVELPLYKGGGISATQNRVATEIKSLEDQKTSAENIVGSQVSGAFTEMVKDYIRTETTKDVVEAARKNLELVMDFYAEGKISVSDLLDARTNLISAEQLEVATRYNYLKSVANLERSIGEYFVLMDEAEREEAQRAMDNYVF